ncbi:MAG: hypothetical protein PW788_04205 [Micavibrio sp.]|nr:hypothetical protein [Micavibrio sp.]
MKTVLAGVAFIFALSFMAVPAVAEEEHCPADKAVYAPKGDYGDYTYEMVIEDLHPEYLGGDNAKLHIKMYSAETKKLLTTVTLTNSCIGSGLVECKSKLPHVASLDIMALNKDMTYAREGLPDSAPYAIILPHAQNQFYYNVDRMSQSPDVQYFSKPPETMDLPPDIWIRQKCGVPSRHFGHTN